MRHLLNIRGIENVFAYQAPENQNVVPYEIPPDREVIELLTGGRVYFSRNGVKKAYGLGTMFWHLPGDKTIYEKDPRNPYTCVTFTFSTKIGPSRQVPRVTLWRRKEEVEGFAQSIIRAFYDVSYDRETLCSCSYSRLFWEAYECSRGNLVDTLPDSLRSLIESMEKSLEREWTIEDMARLARTSVPALHLLFRKHVGRSPHQYLLRRRVQEARSLLATTSLPVKEVGYLCGFKNIETFYRAFKKQVGTTPFKYRQKHLPPGHTMARNA